MIRDRFEDQREQLVEDEDLRSIVFGTSLEGYLPDEDDPAWPSRSGQAD